MRKSISIVLTMMLTAGGPSGVLAAQAPAQSATLSGTARQTDSTPLSSAKVQVRSVETGQLAASTFSGQAGEFTFAGLPPGNYILEVADAAGRIVGTTPLFELAPGVAASMSVTAAGAGAAVGSGAGFSILGMGPVASMAVLGAAGAAAVTAVVSTRPDASPSR
jgi:hypothetical protein